MSAPSLSVRPQEGRAVTSSQVAACCAAVFGSALAGSLIVDPRGLRLVMAGAAAALLVGIGTKAPDRLLPALVVWLAALGLVRRLADITTDAGSADPLLLVGAVALVMLAATAVGQGAFRRKTALSKAVLALGALALLGAFNPLQGSFLSGLSGLLFVLVPMLAFWVGRELDDDRLGAALKLAAALAVGAAAYGLGQTFVGFPSWDAVWIATADYASLDVGGTIRPFSTFSGAAEYGYFAAVAILVLVAFGLRRRLALPITAALSLLAVAVFYQSSRTVLALLALALCLMFCARHRLPLPLALVGCIALLVAVPLAVGRITPTDRGGEAATQLRAHQVRGLANPLDTESSTLRIHLSLLESGLRSAVSQPLGIGTGAVTIAGRTFGGVSGNTETDPSNVAVALGLPGLAAYLTILVAGLRRAYGAARSRRDALGLIALGILAATLFQWLNGGQYAVAFLPWLVLGWLDRPEAAEEEPTGGT